MTADRHDERGISGAEPQRSLFSTLWFRVVLVVIVVGIVGALAAPYVLDLLNPPPKPMALKPPGPPTAPAAPKMPPPTPGVAQAPPPSPAAAPPQALAPGGSQKPSAAAPAPSQSAATTGEKQTERPKTTRPAKAIAAVSQPKAAGAAGTSYWVQVGAFKDPAAAKRLAARLRGENYRVEESSTGLDRASARGAPLAASSGETASAKYDVFVTGRSATEVAAKLSAKGLSTEPAGTGVMVKPSLPLADAVALSKDLAVEGLQVQVRRAGKPAPVSAAPAAGASGAALHRVRVGPYGDRAAATTAVKELEEKGYRPFIARGGG